MGWVRTSLAAATCAIALLTGSSCAVFSRAGSEPKEVVQVQVTSASFSREGQGEAVVKVTYANRLDERASISRLDWELWLSGRRFASGAQLLSEAVESRSERSFLVRLPLAMGSMAQQQGESRVRLEMRGVLFGGGGSGSSPHPFETESRLMVDRPPSFEE
jgi:hypothetical protein